MNALFFKFAASVTTICPGSGADANCGLPTTQTGNLQSGTLHEILQIFLGILGGIALLMIVIAGLRFITSAGDAQKAAHARTTIIFALLGLVIAIVAQTILIFIVKRL